MTLEFVEMVIEDGRNAIREKFLTIDNNMLEVNEKGEKGPGYIICRLQLHALAHANQMAYLRQMLDPEWHYGGIFGDMATAYIRLSYFTERDITVRGF